MLQRTLRLLIGLVSGLSLAVGCSRAPVRAVSVRQLKDITDADSTALVIDVRAPEEYLRIHARPVKRVIRHTEILDSLVNLPADRATPIYLICRSGRRSGIAGQALLQQGYENVYNVAGGTNAWVSEGFPVDSGAGVLGP